MGSQRMGRVALALATATAILAGCSRENTVVDPAMTEATQAVQLAQVKVASAAKAASDAAAKLPKLALPPGSITFSGRTTAPDIPDAAGAYLAPPTHSDSSLPESVLAEAKVRAARIERGSCAVIAEIAQQSQLTTTEKMALAGALMLGRGVTKDTDKAAQLYDQAFLEERSIGTVASLAQAAGFFAAEGRADLAGPLMNEVSRINVSRDVIRQYYGLGAMYSAVKPPCASRRIVANGVGGNGDFAARFAQANESALARVAAVEPVATPLTKNEFETTDAFQLRKQAADEALAVAARRWQADLGDETIAALSTSLAGSLSVMQFQDLAYQADKQEFTARLASQGGELSIPVTIPAPLAGAEADKVDLARARIGMRIAFGQQNVLTVQSFFTTGTNVVFFASSNWNTGLRFGPETKAALQSLTDAEAVQAQATAALDQATGRLEVVRAQGKAHSDAAAADADKQQAQVMRIATWAGAIVVALAVLAYAAILLSKQWRLFAAQRKSAGGEQAAGKWPSPAVAIAVTAASVVLGLVAVVAVASPYIKVWSLKRAFDNGDGTTVAQSIDFPAVRESLKSDMAAEAASKAAGASNEAEAFGSALGGSLAVSLAGSFLDNMFTESTVETFIANSEKRRTASADASNSSTANSTVETNYRSWGRFEVNVKSGNDFHSLVVLARDGLFGWKIVGLRKQGD